MLLLLFIAESIASLQTALNKLLTYSVLRLTQPPTLSGMENE